MIRLTLDVVFDSRHDRLVLVNTNGETWEWRAKGGWKQLLSSTGHGLIQPFDTAYDVARQRVVPNVTRIALRRDAPRVCDRRSRPLDSTADWAARLTDDRARESRNAFSTRGSCGVLTSML